MRVSRLKVVEVGPNLDGVNVVEVEEVVVFIAFLLEGVRLVDTDRVGQLAVRLKRTRLVRLQDLRFRV